MDVEDAVVDVDEYTEQQPSSFHDVSTWHQVTTALHEDSWDFDDDDDGAWPQHELDTSIFTA